MPNLGAKHFLLATSALSFGAVCFILYKTLIIGDEENDKNNEEEDVESMSQTINNKEDFLIPPCKSKKVRKDSNSLTLIVPPEATPNMLEQDSETDSKVVYKVCITGGPHGGKKTGLIQ